MIVVGGTAFTAAAMVAGNLRDGTRMTRADCAGLIEALLARNLDARKRLAHIRPQRADILPAGLIVVDEACRLLGVDAFTVSEADLLLGSFAEQHLDALSDVQLDRYEDLLENSDGPILDWITGRMAPPPEQDSDVLRILMNFRYRPRPA